MFAQKLSDTPWLFFSIKLNQIINNFQLPYRIQWHLRDEQWIYRNQAKVLPYTIITWSLQGIIYLTLIYEMLIYLLGYKSLTFYQVFFSALVVANQFTFFSLDLLMSIYGREWVGMSNLVLEFLSADYSKPNAGLTSKQENLVGLILTNIGLQLACLVNIAIPVTMVYKNRDPLLMILEFYGIETGVVTMLIRYLICFMAFSLSSVMLRTFTLTGMLLGFIGTATLKNIVGAVKFTYSKSRHYRQLCIAVESIQGIMRIFFSTYLSTVFAFIVVGTNAFLVSMKHGNYPIALLAIGFTVSASGITAFAVHMGCHQFEITKKALINWKSCKGPIHLRKTLRSLRPMLFKVGEVGKMDQEMNLNYFNSILEYIVTALVIINDR